MNAAVLTTYSLWWREVIRFLRQRQRVTAAVLQPVIFWILFGVGLGASFRPEGTQAGVSYLEYYFPGTIALIVLFTALFASISIIEDRNEGFLQAVLVAPVPRLSIVLGKVLGGATLAVVHGLVFAVLAVLSAPLVHLDATWISLLGMAAAMFLMGVGLSSIGFLLAWRTDSVAGFHAIMMLLLFPMWLLSGAFFPAAGVPVWLRVLMQVNPLTYSVALMRYSFYRTTELGPDVPGFALTLGVSIGFSLLVLLLAPRALRRARPS